MKPRATYRIQFTSAFCLDDAVGIVPYLSRLGISHLYASPILTARAGSTHGYDIVDHGSINPELGGMPALRRLVAALRSHGMGLLLDIVPNHMGVAGAENRLWLNVLEWGRSSPYATWFDIDWEPADARLRGKVLLPFLGTSYGNALEQGELVLKLDEGSGQLSVWYHDHRYPIAPNDYSSVLAGATFAFEARRGAGQARKSFAAARQDLVAGLRSGPALAKQIREALGAFDATTRAGRERLHGLLERQNYRLAWWRAAADEINYRRFFTVNELAGFRVEVPQAFDAAHALLLELWRDGLVDGFRIDHIDGLADPRGYCRKLRRRMNALAVSRPEGLEREPWILVEKILARHERLPAGWQVDGSTGYEFMDAVGGLLHDPGGEAPLTALYEEVSGGAGNFRDEEVAARRQVLRDYLAAELAGAALLLHRVLQRDASTRDFTLTGIRRALAEIAVHFPVYRIYATGSGPADKDLQVLDWAVAEARRNVRAVDWPLMALLSEILSGTQIRQLPPGPARRDMLAAVRRFQQLTGPTAAKSVEDTAFYRHVRLISRNEVGSDPGRFCVSPHAFRRFAKTYRATPDALLATATHDHKRGEDVRARLTVLSEMPSLWSSTVQKWFRLNAPWKQEVDGVLVLQPRDEYQLYQTLVGSWPLNLDAEDQASVRDFIDRISHWLLKALREAKLRTDWGVGSEAYEQAALHFVAAIFDPSRNASFASEVARFVSGIDRAGLVKSLTQTGLKCLSIGLPDFYQGTEWWDFSLLDPDNRRPVDFAGRSAALRSSPSGIDDGVERWRDGSLKQEFVARLLGLRAQVPMLFRKGRHLELKLRGEAAPDFWGHVLVHEGEAVMLVAPRLTARVLASERIALDGEVGRTTQVVLPEAFRGSVAHNVLTNHRSRIEPRMSLAALSGSRFPIVACRLRR